MLLAVGGGRKCWGREEEEGEEDGEDWVRVVIEVTSGAVGLS